MITIDEGAFRASCNTLLAELQAPAGLEPGLRPTPPFAPPAIQDPDGPPFVLITLSQLAPRLSSDSSRDWVSARVNRMPSVADQEIVG